MLTNLILKKDVHQHQIEILKVDKDVEEEHILVSPAMAAAAAIKGHLTDVRKFSN